MEVLEFIFGATGLCVWLYAMGKFLYHDIFNCGTKEKKEKKESVDLEIVQVVAKAIRENGTQTESKNGWCNLYVNSSGNLYSLGGVIFPSQKMAKQHTYGKVIVAGQEYRYLETLPAPESFKFESNG